MNVMKAKDLGKFVKGKKNPLLVTGSLCDELPLDKSLLDYAVQIYKKLKERPVAATANTVVGLKERGLTIYKTKKMWIGEIAQFTQPGQWKDPMIKERPDVLIFLGYTPTSLNWICSMVADMDTVALSYQPVEEATGSLGDTVSLKEFEKNVDDFVGAL
ncbi:MAG: carbon monoxide dehydrogenase beta subunit family protein [Dehalococcoidia bacterium]|jgi:CO dehydrogenase/acetyl-CoA synthase epsilon subunit|nr:carbon monoxide dehydrogenase beta subunit family protein [Dehalococcoidia bacterium]